MSLTPRQTDLYSQSIVDIYSNLELTLFDMLVKRLKISNSLDKDTVFAWQVKKMQELHMFRRDVMIEIAKATGISIAELSSIIADVANKGNVDFDNQMRDALNQGRVDLLPQSKPNLPAVISGYYEQSKDGVNLINQTMLQQFDAVYTDILNKTTSDVMTGLLTPKKALDKAMFQWADKGIPALVDKSGKKWSADTYVRLVTRSAVNNTYNKVEELKMDEYGIDYVVVSSHQGAREKCFPYQGKIYSRYGKGKKYASLDTTSYGDPGGLLGCNCRHKLFPYIPGYSNNNFEQFAKKENDKVYELTQKQRSYERNVRHAKRKLSIAESSGDKAAINKASKEVRNRQKVVREFTKSNDLTRQYNREKFYK